MKKNLKLINIAGALLILLFFYSCDKKSDLKIGLLIPNLSDERFPKDRDNFTAEISALGGTVISKEAHNDDKIQIEQAQELINQGVKVLVVICINKNTAATIVRNAHENGVKVIAYDRIISNCDLDYFVSFDNVKVGELMAQGVLKLKNTGNFFLLGGDKGDQNAVWVREGMLNVLKPLINQGNIHIVYDVYIEDWSSDNANQVLKQYLNLGGTLPDAIVSAYDGLSTGAVNALIENNIPVSSFPAISGQNAELEACRNIVNGKQTMTVYKPLKNLAKEVANLAMKVAKNEKITNTLTTINNGTNGVPSVLIEPTAVDVNNMKSTIINDGFWKEADIYSVK